MSEKVLCEKSDLVAIADAVREATGSTENYNVSELTAATVETISAGGSGGNVETCTVTIGRLLFDEISYTGANGLVIKEDAYSTTEIQKEVQKGTIFYGYCEDRGIYVVTGSATILFQNANNAVVAVEGDCEIAAE